MLGNLNKLTGGLLGAARGLLITALFFSAVTLFAGTGIGQKLTEIIAGNKILTFMYEKTAEMWAFVINF